MRRHTTRKFSQQNQQRFVDGGAFSQKSQTPHSAPIHCCASASLHWMHLTRHSVGHPGPFFSSGKAKRELGINFNGLGGIAHHTMLPHIVSQRHIVTLYKTVFCTEVQR